MHLLLISKQSKDKPITFSLEENKMGRLIAKHYPTVIALGYADHTYVSCCDDDTKAWSCWGGKTGGNVLRHGQGSTLRANAIAEPDEKAGITCYAINGVCHQAANRILLPAAITVSGAAGYRLSEAMYGTYGRPRGLLGLCKAPFDQHPGIQGEDPECTACTAPEPQGAHHTEQQNNQDPEEQQYLASVISLYDEAIVTFGRNNSLLKEDDTEAVIGFQMSLFRLMLEYYLGHDTDDAKNNRLLGSRFDTERNRLDIENVFLNNDMQGDEFVDLINDEISQFQNRAANILTADDYMTLFDLPRDKIVILVDPEIAATAYGRGDNEAGA